MNYLKLINTATNFETSQVTAVFRVVDEAGEPVEKTAPVGLIIPPSVVDLTKLKGNAMYAISFSEVPPSTNSVADV